MANAQPSLSKDELISRLKLFFRDRGHAYGLSRLGIFGSYARGEAGPDSDVDIVYGTEPSAKTTLFDLVNLRDELMAYLGRPVDLLEFREKMPPVLRERVAKDAIFV